MIVSADIKAWQEKHKKKRIVFFSFSKEKLTLSIIHFWRLYVFATHLCIFLFYLVSFNCFSILKLDLHQNSFARKEHTALVKF